MDKLIKWFKALFPKNAGDDVVSVGETVVLKLTREKNDVER